MVLKDAFLMNVNHFPGRNDRNNICITRDIFILIIIPLKTKGFYQLSDER
jgi:hypothetical protein